MSTATRPVMDGLPAGPTTRPAVQAVRYHRDPIGYLRAAARAYGPVSTLRMPMKEPIVAVGDPARVERL